MRVERKGTLGRLKEMETGKDEKTRFLRAKEGVELYHMSRTTFMRLAQEAGALYKINQLVLVLRQQK